MKNHYFLSQPHQPFFVLAFINAMVSMLIFALFSKGIITSVIPIPNYHAYSLIYLLFTPAFLAFLFTTFPRFSGTLPIEKIVYMTIVIPFVIGSLFFIFGAILSSFLVSTAMIILLIGHLLAINILRKVYNSSVMEDNRDMFWILVSMGAGGVSHLLFIIGYISDTPFIINFAIEIAIYLYLFMVTFSVAQRMVPFFSHATGEKDRELLKVIAILLIVHVLLESIISHLSFVVDFILIYLIGKELLNWELPFPNENPLLWILHLALFWIPIAFLFSGFSNLIALFSGVNFLFLDIHILVLGFILTILIGFGTRVTLGHSGNPLIADKWTTILFYWTQVVVISRLITSIIFSFGWNFLFWFDITVTVWLVLFGLWGFRFFSILIFGKKLGE
jgi:uncharacterized protein involved in response to NO